MNMRWRWIEISPTPMPVSDLARFLSVAPKKQRLTLARPCASVRAIRMAYIWMNIAGIAKLHLGSWEQAVAWFRRAIEANRNYPPVIFYRWPPPSRSSVDLTRRIPQSRPVSRSTRAFAISRARAAWTARSDDPTYLAQLEPILDGLRKAGLPEE